MAECCVWMWGAPQVHQAAPRNWLSQHPFELGGGRTAGSCQPGAGGKPCPFMQDALLTTGLGEVGAAKKSLVKLRPYFSTHSYTRGGEEAL